MSSNPSVSNGDTPFKVFKTEAEWDIEVKQIIQNCLDYISRNRQTQNPPPPDPQSPQTHGTSVLDPGSKDAQHKLEAEIAQMQKEIPGFDFKKLMMSNESFKSYIMHGYSVKEAYAMSANESAKPQKKRLGIRENGIRSAQSGASVNDAMSMNDRDFKHYIQSIMGGNL